MLTRNQINQLMDSVRLKAQHVGPLKIVCFGASLTQQSKGNGFVDHLAKALMEVIPGASFKVERVAHGACHLNDAGFFNVDKVLSLGPDICLLDWHSTGCDLFQEDRFVYILTKLIDAGVLPVHLIFPDLSRPVEYGSIHQARYLNRIAGVPMINLRDIFGMDPSLVTPFVRDHAHTNAIGAIFYSRLISLGLGQLLDRDARMPVREVDVGKIATAASTWSCGNAPLAVVFGQRLELDLSAADAEFVEIFAELMVGKYSPIVATSVVTSDGVRRILGEISTWDESCSYSRVATKRLVSPFVAAAGKLRVTIEISSKRPDYSLCRAPNIVFDVKPVLYVRRLYGIGCSIAAAANCGEPRAMESIG